MGTRARTVGALHDLCWLGWFIKGGAGTVVLLVASVGGAAEAEKTARPCPLTYINTTFENASPLYWEIGAAGEVNVFFGNWVVQGMIRRLLESDDKARAYLQRYAVYVMPMANKDGVARGWTRFNVAGKDLNRNWDQPADSNDCPENHALETWIESMIAHGRQPNFMIDFHNDESGRLHISRPNSNLEPYLAQMGRFETLLRQHTWFTEGATGGNSRTVGSIGEGLLERYGIDACIHELNANWMAGLNDYPSGKNWELYGRELCEVFYRLFDQNP